MTATDEYLTASQFLASEGVDDWRVVEAGACAFFSTTSLAQAAEFIGATGELPGVDDHPPAFDVRQDGVTIRLITMADDWYGPSQRDVDLARRISAVARDLGLAADPSRLQSFLVIPGAPDTAAVMPFWRAVLGYEPRADSPDEDLVDPKRIGPSFWFEAMDEPRPGGLGAIHIAVWVPAEVAEARVAAALAAGGRIVRDVSPSWWTLADAAGNEADIATIEGRD
jgi:4a-hydroxytetrahydrobiopterin dehydratase